jgi:hypothetical protein
MQKHCAQQSGSGPSCERSSFGKLNDTEFVRACPAVRYTHKSYEMHVIICICFVSIFGRRLPELLFTVAISILFAVSMSFLFKHGNQRFVLSFYCA